VAAGTRQGTDRVDDPRLLGPRDEVVHQHPHPPAGPRTERADHRRQVVHPIEHLDDDALDAQVVTPDLLDQLRVVTSFDEQS
jgi:hypothetical protein